jgi:hypothetical protein
LLPDPTPIRLTFTLALELFASPTHSSAALRAYAIQNAGHHICARPDSASHDLHTTLRITANHQPSAVHVKARPVTKAEVQLLSAIRVPKCKEEVSCLIRMRDVVCIKAQRSCEPRHQRTMETRQKQQRSPSQSRLRRLPSRCEGGLLIPASLKRTWFPDVEVPLSPVSTHTPPHKLIFAASAWFPLF